MSVSRRLEALAWMTRFHRLSSPLLIAAAGWLAGGAGSTRKLVGLLVVLACLGGAAMIVNDVMDSPDDVTTNPATPIPQGLVSIRMAVAGVVGLVAVAVAVLHLITEGSGAGLILMVLLPGAVPLSVLYSRYKHAGAAGSLVVAVFFAASGITGYVAAGGSGVRDLALLAGYGFIRGFFTNVAVALRDVDTDPLVGVRTIPVRIGAQASFRWCLLASAVLWGIVVVSALLHAEVVVPLALVGLAATLVVVCAPGTYRRLGRPAAGRDERIPQLRRFDQERLVVDTAFAATFDPVVAVVLGCFFGLLWLLGNAGYAHHRRVLLDG